MQPTKISDDKYKGVPFVILDIPRIIVDDNFKEVWKENAIPVVRLRPDSRYTWTPEEAERKSGEAKKKNEYFHNEYTTPNWIGFSPFEPMVNPRFASKVIDGKSILPRFMEQLHDHLPILNIKKILFWSNQRPIGLHRDLNEQYPYPSSLRILISDENPEPTFWMQPKPESAIGAGEEKIPFDPATARFVDTRHTESNTFVYNNQDWLHGARKDPAYSKILCSLSITWDHNNNKFSDLLDQSILRYGDNR
jgi:hypothetical protein